MIAVYNQYLVCRKVYSHVGENSQHPLLQKNLHSFAFLFHWCHLLASAYVNPQNQSFPLRSGDRDMGLSPMMADCSHDVGIIWDQFESKLLGPIGAFISINRFPPSSAHEPATKQLVAAELNRKSYLWFLLSPATTSVLWGRWVTGLSHKGCGAHCSLRNPKWIRLSQKLSLVSGFVWHSDLATKAPPWCS